MPAERLDQMIDYRTKIANKIGKNEMKTFSKAAFIFVLISLSIFSAGCSGEERNQVGGSVESRVDSLQSLSQKNFGVDLNAISLLLDASPGTVYTENAVSVQDREQALSDLEKAGYVKVNKYDAGGEKYISVERTKNGQELANLIER